ncbi:UMP kinase [Candidatus Kaiserbacteria bacterium]|nr:UMP kinase [Candidatus Kaiserbacteria bacterium]
MQRKETIVLSVGGSLIVPNQIDISFLRRLKALILHEITANNRRFVLITGGGKAARQYQDAAAEISELNPEDLDWLGIHSTRLNAHLLRTIFRDTAYPVIVTNPDDVKSVPPSSPLIIGAGYRPGASSDLRAVQIADRIGAHTVVNLSNIDYVYTADPKKDFDAEKIEDISWKEFRKLIPSEWDPGLSAPFDPVAAAYAEEVDIEVAVINGKALDELEHYLNGEPFVGTRIHS